MDAPLSSCPDGHRILVSFAVGDLNEMMYLRYCCDDPTCDWAVIEFGEDECKEIERITDSLLTHEVYDVKSQETRGAHARPKKTSQPSLFPEPREGDL